MISFAPSEEQKLIASMVERLARDVLRAQTKPLDQRGIRPEVFAQLWSIGAVEMALQDSDGAPRSRTTSCLILEALGSADASLAVALAAPLGYVHAVLDHGSDEQRERLRAEWSTRDYRAAAVLVQEPVFAFDGVSFLTRVAADGTGYLLNGVKSFVPLADACTEFLVVANGGEGAQVYRVPADSPGVCVAAPAGSLGLKGLQMTEVSFVDVALPASARLGGEHGCDAQALVNAARVATGSILTGVAGAVLEHLVPYLKLRVAHGTALARKQSVAFRLADMSIAVPSMRWMCWRAASAMEKGRRADRDARLAQLHCAEQSLWITDEGIQLMGGHGYMRDQPVERWYRDVRTLASLEGVGGI